MLSPANVEVRMVVAYWGKEPAPSYHITALTHPECLQPDGPVSACRGALGKGSPDVESFRRNLQVTSIQSDGTQENIQFDYAQVPGMPWSGRGNTSLFAPAVLTDIVLPGERQLHLEWGWQDAANVGGLWRQASPRPGLGAWTEYATRRAWAGGWLGGEPKPAPTGMAGQMWT